MHHIQRKVLNKLLYAKSLTYSQMRPSGVESNHFAYHLEQLVKAGLVAKNDKQYFLAPQGLAQIDRMSQENMVDRVQPHILTVIDITNDKGETLVFERAFQPYIEQIGFPLGKTHMEETVEEAAVRELHEKTGLAGLSLTQRGIAYVHVKQQGYTITKALCHVFSGVVQGAASLPAPTKRGMCRWVDAAEIKPEQAMPGFLDIKKLLDHSQASFFFKEFLYQI